MYVEVWWFRPGLELLKVKRNQVGFITDPGNPKSPIMKITLLETKKDRHTLTVADWFRDEVYPNIINRYQNSNSFDYLFFPKAENRDKLFNRIRKNFERISDKEVDPNVVAIHSNTSVAMINKHYQDTSDSRLVRIHNKIFPERTTNIKNKVLKKK